MFKLVAEQRPEELRAALEAVSDEAMMPILVEPRLQTETDGRHMTLVSLALEKGCVGSFKAILERCKTMNVSLTQAGAWGSFLIAYSTDTKTAQLKAYLALAHSPRSILGATVSGAWCRNPKCFDRRKPHSVLALMGHLNASFPLKMNLRATVEDLGGEGAPCLPTDLLLQRSAEMDFFCGECGVDPNIPCEIDGSILLVELLKARTSDELVKKLVLKYKASIFARDPSGECAVSWAKQNGRLEVINEIAAELDRGGQKGSKAWTNAVAAHVANCPTALYLELQALASL